jgi:hypothetical protein
MGFDMGLPEYAFGADDILTADDLDLDALPHIFDRQERGIFDHAMAASRAMRSLARKPSLSDDSSDAALFDEVMR